MADEVLIAPAYAGNFRRPLLHYGANAPRGGGKPREAKGVSV